MSQCDNFCLLQCNQIDKPQNDEVTNHEEKSNDLEFEGQKQNSKTNLELFLKI